jgi:hypothetical protein
MEEKREQPIVYSQKLRAGKRTYFFDVKETSGGEYYLSLTESKRFFDKIEGNFYYKKRSLFLYKESMKEFINNLHDVVDFIEEKQGFVQEPPKPPEFEDLGE